MTRFYDGKWDEVGGQAVNLGVDDDAVGLPFASSQFEVITEDIYNTLVDGMKTGGSLEVKGEYDTFLAGGGILSKRPSAGVSRPQARNKF